MVEVKSSLLYILELKYGKQKHGRGREGGGLIHFDPLPSTKQTPQTKASPKNITSTSATENSNAGTGWAPQHGNLHKANYAESREIILNVIILISISNIYPNTPDR